MKWTVYLTFQIACVGCVATCRDTCQRCELVKYHWLHVCLSNNRGFNPKIFSHWDMVNCHWFIWTRFNVDSHKTITGRTLTTDHPSLITLRYTPHKTINGSCLRLSQVNLNSLCRNDRCDHKPYHWSPLATPLSLITPRYTPLSVTAGRAVKPLIEIGYSFVCMPIKPINIKEFPRSSLLARVIDWGLEILFYRRPRDRAPLTPIIYGEILILRRLHA